eukprot:4134389-Amphidinium_carterae.1
MSSLTPKCTGWFYPHRVFGFELVKDRVSRRIIGLSGGNAIPATECTPSRRSYSNAWPGPPNEQLPTLEAEKALQLVLSRRSWMCD